MRVGTGFDAHPFERGRRLVLAGVEIPAEDGLAGHSDADAGLHALIDALLGAAALGDIGSHFPAADPRFKDADSRDLLRQTVAMVRAAGFAVTNVDVTLVAERPRLGPYVRQMREAIAADLRITVDSVSVKATTANGVGSLGRGDGIAALAAVLLE